MTEDNGDATLQFRDLPPFPDNVPTAPLRRLNLQKLIDWDPHEADRLWESCTGSGFFYLDLRGAKAEGKINGDEFIEDARELFGVAADVFDLPLGEKMKYDLSSRKLYFGYKALGAVFLDKQGNRDRNEQYYISKDDVLDLAPPLPSPEILTQQKPLLTKYIYNAHAITVLILAHLNDRLLLPAGTLQAMHRLTAPSGDQVRFVHSPPQPLSDRKPALGAHTDFGSVTLLFNRLGGLQIPVPGATTADFGSEDAWLFVRPVAGHCVVNLGDAMVKFTRGVLTSSVHRVVNPPGEQAASLRQSLVYFARPEDDVVLKALKGSDVIDAALYDDPVEEISSKEWTLRRALGRRRLDTFDQSQGTEGVRRDSPRVETKA